MDTVPVDTLKLQPPVPRKQGQGHADQVPISAQWPWPRSPPPRGHSSSNCNVGGLEPFQLSPSKTLHPNIPVPTETVTHLLSDPQSP